MSSLAYLHVASVKDRHLEPFLDHCIMPGGGVSAASTVPFFKDIDVDSERQPSSRLASEERPDSL